MALALDSPGNHNRKQRTLKIVNYMQWINMCIYKLCSTEVGAKRINSIAMCLTFALAMASSTSFLTSFSVS